MAYGRLTPQSGVWQVSGEATPSTNLPAEYVSTPMPTSPIAGNYQPATEQYNDIRRAPVVDRHERMVGMRYLYHRGAIPMPVNQGVTVTARRGVNVNMSAFNVNEMGPIHDAGFNDALFQAGYPGFNLGLSFKVQTLPHSVSGPGYNMRMASTTRGSNTVNRLRRPSGKPKERR